MASPDPDFCQFEKRHNRAITYYLFNSICVLPTFYYSWKLTLILYPLFCTVCFVYAPAHHSFFVSLQMTLLIHVNSMTAFNASHFLNSETWHMISIIGYQRRSTSVILRRLTPKNCHQSMITWWTFVPSAVEKYWKIHILFYVKAVKEGYIETVLLYHVRNSCLSKIVQPGSADYVMKVYFLLII